MEGETAALFFLLGAELWRLLPVSGEVLGDPAVQNILVVLVCSC